MRKKAHAGYVPMGKMSPMYYNLLTYQFPAMCDKIPSGSPFQPEHLAKKLLIAKNKSIRLAQVLNRWLNFITKHSNSGLFPDYEHYAKRFRRCTLRFSTRLVNRQLKTMRCYNSKLCPWCNAYMVERVYMSLISLAAAKRLTATHREFPITDQRRVKIRPPKKTLATIRNIKFEEGETLLKEVHFRLTSDRLPDPMSKTDLLTDILSCVGWNFGDIVINSRPDNSRLLKYIELSKDMKQFTCCGNLKSMVEKHGISRFEASSSVT